MKTTYILGSGAIGFPLAVFLARAGRPVVAVRTSVKNVARSTIKVTVGTGTGSVDATVETISLAQLEHIDGPVVVAAKAYANDAIARALKDRGATGPIVVMQNGLGVEEPFLKALSGSVYRCVVYATGQPAEKNGFTFRFMLASPVGVVRGAEADLARCVDALSTDAFPLHMEPNIQRATWRKAIINAVFNSICPLLDVDNGVFAHDDAAAGVARTLIRECVAVTDTLDLGLDENELMKQVLTISQRSDGLLISTLQDIRHGRPTEMAFLNLEMVRIAAAMQPPLQLPTVEALGNLVTAKSHLSPTQ